VIKFIFSTNYESTLSRIEDHIFTTTGSLELVEKFLDDHDQILIFLGQNPKTSAVHPVTGDQSWLFGDGRYRLFFKSVDAEGSTTIYLIDLIDNRELNLQIYPGNRIPTYEEE